MIRARRWPRLDPGRAVARPGDRPRPRPAGPVRVGVRALQRAHRAARQPRRGRAARAARHLPRTRSTSCARCRTRRPATATPSPGQTIVNVTNGKLIRLLVDDEPFDVRYGELRAHERVLDLRAGTLTRTRRLGLAGRPAGPGPRPPGWSRSPSGRSPRSSTRSRRSTARCGSILQSELVANEDLPRELRDATRGSPRCWTRRWSREEHQVGGDGAVAACTAPGAAACGWPPAMDHVVEAPGRRRRARPRPTPDWARTTVACRAASPASGCGWSSSSPTAGPAVRSRPALRDQVVGGADRRPLRRLGRAAARAARVPRRLLGRRRRRGRRRPGAAAGGPVRAVPRAAGRRPGRAAADRGQGPDRPRVRRAHVLGHRDVRAAGARPTPCRRPSADVLRWRHSTLDLARERARTLGLAGAAFPWRTIRGAGVLGVLAGRHRRVPHQRRHRRRGRALPSTSPATTSSTGRGRAGAAGRDGPAVAARSGHHDRHGAVPHRRRHRPGRVHARSPTTTSTPT